MHTPLNLLAIDAHSRDMRRNLKALEKTLASTPPGDLEANLKAWGAEQHQKNEALRNALHGVKTVGAVIDEVNKKGVAWAAEERKREENLKRFAASEVARMRPDNIPASVRHSAATFLEPVATPTEAVQEWLKSFFTPIATGEQLASQLKLLSEDDLFDIFDAAKTLHDMNNLVHRADDHSDPVRNILDANGCSEMARLYDAVCLEGATRIRRMEVEKEKPCRTLCEIAATHFTLHDDLAEAARIMALAV